MIDREPSLEDVQKSLKTLLCLATTDTGGGQRCAMFLLSLWDGDSFKVDLQALLYTDQDVFEAMLTGMEYLYINDLQLYSLVTEEQVRPIL